MTFYGFIIVDGGSLTPRSAFVTLFAFDMIRGSMYRIPRLVTNSARTFVSVRRILRFLNEDERPPSHIEPLAGSGDAANEFAGVTADFMVKKRVWLVFCSRNGRRSFLVEWRSDELPTQRH